MAQFDSSIYTRGADRATQQGRDVQSMIMNLGRQYQQQQQFNQNLELAKEKEAVRAAQLQRANELKARQASMQPEAILAQHIQDPTSVTDEQRAMFEATQRIAGAERSVHPVTGQAYQAYAPIQLSPVEQQFQAMRGQQAPVQQQFEEKRGVTLDDSLKQMGVPESISQSPAFQKAVGEKTIEEHFKDVETKKKREAALPQIVEQGTGMINLIDDILSHEGFEGSVGGVGGLQGLQAEMFPVTEAQRDFAPYMKQLKGKSFLQGFQTLKGGGTITEVEGKKAEEAIGRLSQTQTEEGFKKSMQDLKDVINAGIERARTGKVAVNSDALDEKDPRVIKALKAGFTKEQIQERLSRGR